MLLASALTAEACNLTTPARFFPDASTSGDCPMVYTSTGTALADDECLLGHCKVTVTQKGCDLSLAWGSGCPLLPSSGKVDSSGIVTTEETSALGVCQGRALPAGPSSSPVFTMSCSSVGKACHVDLYTPPFPGIGAAAAYTIVHAADWDPGGGFDHLGYLNPLSGYMIASALLDEVFAVVIPTAGTAGPLCRPEYAAVWAFYDRMTMAPVKAIPAPACLVRLLADPANRGFFGLYGNQEHAPRIGWFDSGGALVRSATVAIDPESWFGHIPTVLARSEDQSTLYAVYSVGGGGRVAFIDPATLATRAYAKTPDDLRALAPLDDIHIAVAAAQVAQLYYFDAASGQPAGGIPLARGILAPGSAGFLYHHKESELLVAAVTGTTPTEETVARTVESVAQYFEQPAGFWAVHTWPKDRNLLAVGVTIGDTLEARIALYSPKEGRFLGGSVRIGYGVVQDIYEDADQTLFATMPWCGRVARVRAF
jgi:hypothetical protein